MTEAEAWIEAARLAKEDLSGFCFGIRQLHLRGHISTALEERMKAKLAAYKKRRRIRRDYYWPCTPDGYKLRTAWAKQQAAKCRRKKR